MCVFVNIPLFVAKRLKLLFSRSRLYFLFRYFIALNIVVVQYVDASLIDSTTIQWSLSQGLSTKLHVCEPVHFYRIRLFECTT